MATGVVGRWCRAALAVWALGAGCHDAPPEGWGPPDGADGAPGLGRVEIVHLDVGAGDATLFIGPTGQAALVDGGPDGAGAVVLAELERRGLERLRHLVASHPDADHIGGLDEVAAAVAVDAAWGEGSQPQTAAFAALADALAGTAAGGLRLLDPGDRLALGDGVELICTASGGRLLDGSRVLVADDNDRSLGLLLRHGGFDYHVGGDLGAEVERALGPLLGDLDAVHLHHHGAAGSTCAAWLEALRAEVAVLSVGPNPYDHPAGEVVARLRGLDPALTVEPPAVFQTGSGARDAGPVLGTFAIETDGVRYRLDDSWWEVDE